MKETGVAAPARGFRDLDEAEPARLALPPLPAQIGGHRIVREIGRGGMATVYEAVSGAPPSRVALKVLRRGAGSLSFETRFEAEARLLARLDHPHVARILAAGTHQPVAGDGSPGPVPFLVMEYVEDGLPLTEFCMRRDVPLRERIVLFRRVLEAVGHGHRRGIVHRDLKPANLLVDRTGRPKVIDFGVARSLERRGRDAGRDTEIGQLVGTVQYMSPEQLDGDPRRVDPRADLYALGIVLYELASGRLPYDLRGLPVQRAAQVLQEVSPAPLVVPPAQADGLDVEDLRAVVARLLKKEPERRYRSAPAADHDLGRLLAGQRVRPSRGGFARWLLAFGRDR